MLGKLFKKDARQNTSEASVPDGKTVYAIGDIHGRADLLDALIGEIEADGENSGTVQFIFLGDYVDRGPDSRGVIERLVKLRDAYPDAIFLKGNHEAVMLDFLAEPEDLSHWLDWGGLETLESYGVDASLGRPPAAMCAELKNNLPTDHLAFIKSLTLTHRTGDYLFVHAGIRPGVPLEEQSEEHLLWIRKRFLNAAPAERPEYIVVHGHTPEDKPIDAGWRIGVDTGACYGGALTAVALNGTSRRFISVRD